MFGYIIYYLHQDIIYVGDIAILYWVEKQLGMLHVPV